jgi:cytosine/adenosine deaminase-related metal-dependent hydrolase
MRYASALALLLGLSFPPLCCSNPSDALVIRNVTLIDGTGAAPRAGMTVVVEEDRITGIGAAESVQFPPSARLIDGSGRFLIPGLWDMHVHLRDLDGTLPLFIVNGVTTVRDMGSELEETVDQRARIKSGGLIGPNIKTSGMMLESRSWLSQYVELMRERGDDEEAIEKFLATRVTVADTQEAKEVVDALIRNGADFIKIRHAESPEVFTAIGRAAGEAGTQLVGHYVWIVSLEESADGGQRSVEHNILPGFNEKPLEEKRAIFEALLRNDTHLVPTLVTNKSETLPPEEVMAIVQDEKGRLDRRNRYVSASIRKGWLETAALNAADEERPPPEVIEQMIASSDQFVMEARAAGVKLLAGTDVPTTGTFLGFSLHDELGLLVERYDFTPMEALRSATALPAAFMDVDGEVGTIEEGKRADLVLLDADPLSDISNTRQIAMVIANGRVFDRARLEEILREIETSIGNGAEEEGSLAGGN